MYNIDYLPIAIEDIENIIYYISKVLKNKSAAEKMKRLFDAQLSKIAVFPYGATEYLTNEKLNLQYRAIKIKNYLVLYTIEEENKKVLIARVLYKKRNIYNILK